jgi:hypothetical protein
LKLFYLNLSIAALKHSPSKKGKRDSIKKRTTSEKDGNEPISPVTATNQTNGQGKKTEILMTGNKMKKVNFLLFVSFFMCRRSRVRETPLMTVCDVLSYLAISCG